MAYVNTYIQLYTSAILAFILLGNLHIGGYKVTERSVKVFYFMLFFGFLMLFAGGIDNYLFLPLTKDNPLLESLASGISDMAYFLVIGLFCVYIDVYNRGEGYKISPLAKIALGISIIYGIFWFISGFTGSIYTQSSEGLILGPLYYIGQIGGYIITLITIYILIRRARNFDRGDIPAFISFIAGPLIGSLVRNYFKHVTLMPLMVALSLVIIQIFVQGARELRFRQQMVEMSQMRTDLLMSRMKPHFIYNVLNTIFALCDDSAEEAQRAIGLFSQYLRNNLVDLDSHKLIPFEEEMQHVENYLEIEKIRFGKRLEVIYDIEATDFMIPPLALQSIVENAVRHGIEKKVGGGTLSISSKEDSGNNVIIVKDTGVGFTPDSDVQDSKSGTGKKHVGIYSSSYRLETLCGGKLTIESHPGEGTCATIVLPK